MGKKIIIITILGLVLLGAYYFIGSNGLGRVGGDLTGDVFLENADYSPERIIVPVKIHLVREQGSGHFTTTRDGANVLGVFKEVNRIWDSAGVYFAVEEIEITDLNWRAIPNALKGNATDLYLHGNFEYDMINVFFTHDLNGINGLALGLIDTALVTDFTTVNDYRTTAHEMGHLLGLQHVPENDRLMARGVNGEELDSWEIGIARENALEFV